MIHQGFYRVSVVSGAVTLAAAGTATAGHMFAFRWSDATKIGLLDYIRVRWQTTTAFTTPQELQFRLFRATAYTVAHSGGTASTLTTPNLKKRVSDAASAVGDIRIGTTAGLTAGTHTLDAESLATWEGFSQLGATPNMPQFDDRWDASSERGQLTFAQNEGFIIRNEILMGAAGVGRLVVDVAWSEVNP